MLAAPAIAKAEFLMPVKNIIVPKSLGPLFPTYVYNEETLLALYGTNDSGLTWDKVGRAFAIDFANMANREGFMRKILARSEVASDNPPRIKTVTLPNSIPAGFTMEFKHG
jgi:hypothetical protein